jgi:hypothetical protein
MKKAMAAVSASLLLTALCCGSAAAWSHSGRWGSASGGGGSWSASGYRGGSASGGGGTWSGTTAYGTSAYHSPGDTTVYHSTNYYGGYYPAYHPPTTVNYYGSGCWDCGGWSTAGAAAAGAMVGMAAGAKMASASQSAAASSAYSAGYAAGSAASATYPIGSIVTTLPPNCTNPNVGGTFYYLCGNTWFKPGYGANGVYYRVVPTP